MALAYRYKRSYNDAFAGISDAEANAAAYAALRQLAAKKRVISRPTITLRKPINFTQKRGELKGVDTDISATSIVSTTATNTNIIPLNLINQGSGSFNRIGRKTYPKSVRLTGVCEAVIKLEGTTFNYYGATLRCVLVWDNQPNSSAVPNYNDIFGNTNAIGTEASNVNDALRYDNMQRFSVLKDWRITLNPSSNPFTGGTVNALCLTRSFDKYYEFKPISKKETTYSSTQVAPTLPLYSDIATGGLLLVYRVDVNASATTAIAVSVSRATARYRFTD